MGRRIRKALTRGMTEIYGMADAGWKSLSLGIVTLDAEDRFGETLNHRECVLVLLHGAVSIRGQGFDLGLVEGRPTVFGDSPAALCSPPGMYSLKARTDCALAALRCELPAAEKGEPARLARPGAGLTEGADADRRWRVYCDHAVRPGGLVVGETLFAPSASAALPAPLFDAEDRDALLFFCFDEGEGSAKLELDGAGDLFSVEESDTVVVPAGVRPRITPGNCPVYCLWATAFAG